MSFLTMQPSLKKIISPTPARSKSNITPATQSSDTRSRNSTDKTTEALHYLLKLSLLGQKMVEIGASQAAKSESSAGSRLSYPANTINVICKCWTLGSTIPAQLPFLTEKIASSKRDLI